MGKDSGPDIEAWAAFAAAGIMALLLAACGGSNQPAPASSAHEALARAEDGLDSAGGYRVEVHAHNLVLPRWGGIDAATLDVGADGPVATGTLQRTGDGPYTVIFADGQTYFRRATCDHFARIPGGGPDVLQPLFLPGTGILQDAEDARYVDDAGGKLAIDATLSGLGDVRIELDAVSYRPLRIAQQQGSAAGAVFAFSRWGVRPDVQPPAGTTPDQGPGGNPC